MARVSTKNFAVKSDVRRILRSVGCPPEILEGTARRIEAVMRPRRRNSETPKDVGENLGPSEKSESRGGLSRDHGSQTPKRSKPVDMR